MRLTGLAVSLGLLLVAYLFGCELYDRRVGLLAALFAPTFPLFFRLGPAAMTDIPVTFLFLLSLLLVARLRSRPTYPLAMAAGLTIGLGLLSKYTMALIYPVVLVWFVVSPRLRQRKRYLAVTVLTSLGLFSVWLAFAYFSSILGAQSDTLIPYLGMVAQTEWGKRFLAESLLTRLPSALGVYNIPLMILGAVQVLRHRNRSDLFVVLWIAVVFITLTATLPAHRYYMLAFPAIAVLMVRGLAIVPTATSRVLILAWLNCLGALYLFADWERVSHLFVR
jgi:4-amino-4-deoxy-L-arabinose transferase-like glycosyltransferase